MENLIDKTYFTGLLIIPNLNGEGHPIAANVAELNSIITQVQFKYLRNLLGADLYDAFEVGLEGEMVEPPDPEDDPLVVIDPKWIALREQVVNPLANLVYYWWMRNRFTYSTGVGEVQLAAENAKVIANSDKMIKAWNEHVKESREINAWLLSSEDYANHEIPSEFSGNFINEYNL